MKQLQYPQIIPILDIIPIDEGQVRKYLGKIKLKKITIIFFGSDSFVIPILQALEQNFEVVSVVTAPDSAIQIEAQKLGVPVLTPDKLDENSRCDLFVVASYGQILPRVLLDLPEFGSLNVHPSLLPKYRGASPVPATILNEDKQTGVTIIKMDEKMDHGPVVIMKEISLSGQETLLELINKLFRLGAEILIDIIPDFVSGKIKLMEQDHEKATYCKMMKKEDGYFDIEKPPDSETLDRIIRAYYPWPGAWTKWEGKIVKFLPGGLIQMEGKKPIPLKDFRNGYPDFPNLL
ncbi:MAG: methionyl-tRNA formyltransferase [Microgenomates group bacterium Gr01-1014_7]|nr:MAG: methionyl-tRNA formyltransferase [Microgenomates group bacterium Gr01-1014_7]